MIVIGAMFIAFGGFFYDVPFLPGIFILIGVILCLVGIAGRMIAFFAFDSKPSG